MADWLKPLTPMIYNVFVPDHFYPKSGTHTSHIQAVCHHGAGAPKLPFLLPKFVVFILLTLGTPRIAYMNKM